MLHRVVVKNDMRMVSWVDRVFRGSLSWREWERCPSKGEVYVRSGEEGFWWYYHNSALGAIDIWLRPQDDLTVAVEAELWWDDRDIVSGKISAELTEDAESDLREIMRNIDILYGVPESVESVE